jgi:beta-lactamase regulating signal transducer with metallopeptidase domain
VQLRLLAQSHTQHWQTTLVVAGLLPSLISQDASTTGGRRVMRRTYFLVGGVDVVSILWVVGVALVSAAIVVVGLIFLAKGMGAS